MSDSIDRHNQGTVVQPIGQVPKRLPTHGRIRTGMVKAGEKFPRSLKNFRLTSPDEDAIIWAADVYGGTARPWNNPKANPPHQFEVVTTSDVVAVQLVPASVKLSYEKWGNGFLNRRCDGITVHGRKPGGKGKPVVEDMLPCICNQKGNLECTPVTRLNVLLRGMPVFKGVWMLQSNGWNVFAEMPGVAALLDSFADGQLVDAKLRLVERQADGGARKFVVPTLELETSLQELADGKRAELLAVDDDEPPAIVGADPLAALEAGLDDDIEEAEIVEESSP